MMQGNSNLYIDESGSGALYEKRKNYRFFSMTGVIFNKEEPEKAYHLLNKWKNTYLIRHNLPLHGSDLFEDHIDGKTKLVKKYRKIALNKINIFSKAIDGLTEIIRSLNFVTRIYYVDLFKVRTDLRLNPYIIGKKQNIFKQIINEDLNCQLLYPVTIISNYLLAFHEKYINERPSRCGYIFYESQAEYNSIIMQNFNQLILKTYGKDGNYTFGDALLGISFLNKSALCPGIEIADYIGYCETQLLRNRHIKKEIECSENRFKILKDNYLSFKSDMNIRAINVSQECIDRLRKIRIESKHNKKAS
ncbi:hypothetical protein COT62_02465 [Candidatus Roizmanbacteria bacterium CG09_land_8_20_14_0_10_41_9]|uniref:DUF3800 domain-containing protein n=1 Tax=Candidatus Roizmanbacteria bacterium CG09_land_8_20_14_0_10_41_9 TaxID=1974850 RepID=A0A2H0WSM8_9BACT|nr:MAG: hypothetical protein COT62_02465 [Candidatus Roizmanbacteria bacterium CG09_land_8_20_14_0_10_41_9]